MLTCPILLYLVPPLVTFIRRGLNGHFMHGRINAGHNIKAGWWCRVRGLTHSQEINRVNLIGRVDFLTLMCGSLFNCFLQHLFILLSPVGQLFFHYSVPSRHCFCGTSANPGCLFSLHFKSKVWICHWGTDTHFLLWKGLNYWLLIVCTVSVQLNFYTQVVENIPFFRGVRQLVDVTITAKEKALINCTN